MDEGVLQRINLFFKANNITNRRVADIIGMSETTLNSKLNGTRGLDLDTLQKILMQFEELSPDWLMTGKGDMITQNITQNNKHGDNVNTATGNISINKTENAFKEEIELLKKENERLKDELIQAKQTIIDLLMNKK